LKILCLVFSVCALSVSVPAQNPLSPPTGKALIYIYKSFRSKDINSRIYINQHPLGVLSRGTYAIVQIAAASPTLIHFHHEWFFPGGVEPASKPKEISFYYVGPHWVINSLYDGKVEAGKTYYFEYVTAGSEGAATAVIKDRPMAIALEEMKGFERLSTTVLNPTPAP
jgi:hypothetical protein